MKGWFGSGKSRVRRTSLDFRYDLRPSIWQKITERSHLIVAGVGSVAMLGLAGTAIWLALPSDTAEQIVSPVQAAPQVASADTTSTQAQARQPTETAAAVKPAIEPKPPTAADASTVEIASSAPSPGSPTVSVPEPMQIEPLDPTDPRWISATAGHAVANATAAVRKEASKGASKPVAVASAYAEDDGTADKAATAAIPAVKPAQDADKANATVEENPAPEQEVASAGRAGRTARAVTMRARPNSRGGVLGTVPGSTDVQVVSCDQWCEIVYKGKRGFVYRSFLRNNGR